MLYQTPTRATRSWLKSTSRFFFTKSNHCRRNSPSTVSVMIGVLVSKGALPVAIAAPITSPASAGSNPYENTHDGVYSSTARAHLYIAILFAKSTGDAYFIACRFDTLSTSQTLMKLFRNGS